MSFRSFVFVASRLHCLIKRLFVQPYFLQRNACP